MADQDYSDPPPTTQSTIDTDRRRFFLHVLPVMSIFIGIGTALMGAAFRFLRPLINDTQASDWMNVASISELTGTAPIARRIITTKQMGWATVVEEQTVYVLPQANHQVLSSVCPHEGCMVVWRAATNDFLCPCHDSLFASNGALLQGPAQRGLDPFESRVRDGVLQIKYQSFMNDTEERTPLG
jgi:Rieske Fe-S protein